MRINSLLIFKMYRSVGENQQSFDFQRFICRSLDENQRSFDFQNVWVFR